LGYIFNPKRELGFGLYFSWIFSGIVGCVKKANKKTAEGTNVQDR